MALQPTMHPTRSARPHTDDDFEPHRRRSSILAGPRRKSTINIFKDTTALKPDESATTAQNRRTTLFAKPARKSAILPRQQTLGSQSEVTHHVTVVKSDEVIALAAKEARRRTIWIPQDNTTVMTIHPGAHTHTLNDETIQLPRSTAREAAPPLSPSDHIPFHALSRDPPRARTGRRSSLLVAPRRAPLSILKPTIANVILSDQSGCPTGKENLVEDEVPELAYKIHKPNPRAVAAELSGTSRTARTNPSLPFETPESVTEDSHRTRNCSSSKRDHVSQLPVLEEDLERPELYEDSWLANQEISLTQVINTIFAQNYSAQKPPQPSENRRCTYLNLCQQPEIVELHHALFLSIQAGPLSLPSQTEIPRLYENVGLRRTFLNLWLDSYDLELLMAASEAVTARLCVSPGTSSKSVQTGAKDLRKSMRHFLTTTLLQQEDPNVNGVDEATAARKQWQRTWLRSLSIIHLLDLGHACRQVSGCLFNKNSAVKSSQAMLRAMATLVCPSINVPRKLAYLGYALDHLQSPLDEYEYRITNLAIDMRDGVRLARLLDILSKTRHEQLRSTAASQIQQDLHCPTPTRLQKLHNARLSLEFLQRTRGMVHTPVSTILEPDIVDGHRQKTLSLLWTIIAKWGLEYLVPVETLREEIKVLASSNSDKTVTMTSNFSPGPDGVAAALFEWAKYVCWGKGIVINNLTTSFARNTGYVTILDTYSDCTPPDRCRSRSDMEPSDYTIEIPTRDFAQRMSALGSSPSFLTLFTPDTVIPSKSTTLCALAWLASKLIPLARRRRAAVVIQRAWRRSSVLRVPRISMQ
ncbi:Hypothetical protein D9617_1g080550 [Elsinoe fawcettii]|nr:Hypothetical protein D9617_1g080550 [Elsinoe fawcettii]